LKISLEAVGIVSISIVSQAESSEGSLGLRVIRGVRVDLRTNDWRRWQAVLLLR